MILRDAHYVYVRQVLLDNHKSSPPPSRKNETIRKLLHGASHRAIVKNSPSDHPGPTRARDQGGLSSSSLPARYKTVRVLLRFRPFPSAAGLSDARGRDGVCFTPLTALFHVRRENAPRVVGYCSLRHAQSCVLRHLHRAAQVDLVAHLRPNDLAIGVGHHQLAPVGCRDVL